MTPAHLCSNSSDPVREVELIPSSLNPHRILVRIQLAEHVAACCVNSDGAWVEFHKDEITVRGEFVFVEGRPGHRMEASVILPVPGTYSYRIVAHALGRRLIKEGTFLKESPSSGSLPL